MYPHNSERAKCCLVSYNTDGGSCHFPMYHAVKVVPTLKYWRRCRLGLFDLPNYTIVTLYGVLYISPRMVFMLVLFAAETVMGAVDSMNLLVV